MYLQAGLFLALSIVVLYFVVRWFTSQGSFAAAVAQARWRDVPVLLGVAVVMQVIVWIRWHLLLRAAGCVVPFRRTAHAVLVCWPPAVLTPSRANDLLRPVMLRDAIDITTGVGTVLVEKLIDVVVLAAMGAIGMVLGGVLVGAVTMTAVTVAVLGGLAAAVFARDGLRRMVSALPRGERLAPKVDALLLGLDGLIAAPRLLVGVLLTSVGSWLVTAALVYLLVDAMGGAVPMWAVLALWPAAEVAGVAPITQAGMGTRDAAFVLLLGAVGLSLDEGVILAATVGYAILGTWLWVLVGLPFMMRAGITHLIGGSAGADAVTEGATEQGRGPKAD